MRGRGGDGWKAGEERGGRGEREGRRVRGGGDEGEKGMSGGISEGGVRKGRMELERVMGGGANSRGGSRLEGRGGGEGPRGGRTTFQLITIGSSIPCA